MPVPAENMVSARWVPVLCGAQKGCVLRQMEKESGLGDWMFRVGQEATIATPPF